MITADKEAGHAAAGWFIANGDHIRIFEIRAQGAVHLHHLLTCFPVFCGKSGRCEPEERSRDHGDRQPIFPGVNIGERFAFFPVEITVDVTGPGTFDLQFLRGSQWA